MGSDSQFLLGEYGARLDNLEATVGRMDKNIMYLVERETVRGERERQTKWLLTTAGGFVGAIVAFVASILKDWIVQ
jgi:hypothetical protein